jgi:hypothetical protein
MPRVVVPFVVLAVFAAFASCGGETRTSGGGAAPPPGAGYGSSAPPADDMRVLSRDDCIALRDHQIDIAVAEAMTGQNDQGKRLEIEAKVRAENKDKTEAWVKSCSGRSVPSKLLRCWKDAASPASYVACDSVLPADAAVDG